MTKRPVLPRLSFQPAPCRPGARAWVHRLAAAAAMFLPAAAPADDWPGWLGPERDGVWREAGVVESFPQGGPPLLWKIRGGAGYSGPSVVGDRVYLTDRVVGADADVPQSAFQRGTIPGVERVRCLAVKDGSPVWEHRYPATYDVSYPAGPRASPQVHGGKVYTLGTMGHLLCLDAADGSVLWSHDFQKELGVTAPMWGFAAHPLIEGDLVICLGRGPGSTVLAYHKDTGEEVWRALSASEPGYCPPVVVEAGGARQLIVWHPEAVVGMDPKSGRVHWTQPWKIRSGLSIPTPRKLGDSLFLTAFYNGPLMLRLDPSKPGASVLWRGKGKNERKTDGLHSIMATPFLEGGHIYGVCSYGQFRCLRADSGERVWETFAPTTGESTRWGNAFIVKHAPSGRFFLANERGELIIAELSPDGYKEIDRARLIEPDNRDPRRQVVWSHPAFAGRRVFLRNDSALACYSLAADGG